MKNNVNPVNLVNHPYFIYYKSKIFSYIALYRMVYMGFTKITLK